MVKKVKNCKLVYMMAMTLFSLVVIPLNAGEAPYVEVTGSVPNGERLVPFTALVPKGKGPFPLVVMNHGHGGSREEGGGFKRLAEAISAKGIATIRMDFPGCGESKAPFTQNTMTNMISDSNACLEYMLEKYPIDKKRLGIFGYSLGGRIALNIVNRPGQPYKAMGLLAPAVAPGNDLSKLLAGGKASAEQLEAEANEKGFAEFTNAYGQTQQFSKEWFADLRNTQPASKASFAGPVVIVHGGKDRVITASECDEAENALRNAGSTVLRILLPNADHGYGFFSDQREITIVVENAFVSFFRKNLLN
jgi:dienelactone hydrolase